MKPRNQGRPITKSIVVDVEKLAKQNLTAKQIGLKIGRSESAVHNIFRLYNIKRKKW